MPQGGRQHDAARDEDEDEDAPPPKKRVHRRTSISDEAGHEARNQRHKTSHERLTAEDEVCLLALSVY